MNVGDRIGDYIIKEKIENLENRFLVECLICHNKKILSKSNIQKQNMSHTALNCKVKFYEALIGQSNGDYLFTGYKKKGNHYLVTAKCIICGHINDFLLCEIYKGNYICKHNPCTCQTDYYINQIGKTYGDYKIISFHHKEKYYAYYNVECVKCHTKGVKTLSSLMKNMFKHGDECFKMLDDKIYKTVIGNRFNLIVQRCNNPSSPNYKHYGGRNIKVVYDYVIDFYYDFIDEFKEHAKIYGIRNTTFDRIDVNGNYEKNNLRLATQTIQSTNTTRKKYFILTDGTEKVLCDSAMEFGRKYDINGRSVGNVVRGMSKKCGNWKLVKVSDNLLDLEEESVTTKLITT